MADTSTSSQGLDGTGEEPDPTEDATASYEQKLAKWRTAWACYYPRMQSSGWSIEDAVVGAGAPPLNPYIEFGKIRDAWDQALLDNERANPECGLNITQEQLGPRPEPHLYLDVDLEAHDRTARELQAAFQRRRTVQTQTPAYVRTAPTRSDDEQVDRNSGPPQRDTLPVGATREALPATGSSPYRHLRELQGTRPQRSATSTTQPGYRVVNMDPLPAAPAAPADAHHDFFMADDGPLADLHDASAMDAIGGVLALPGLTERDKRRRDRLIQSGSGISRADKRVEPEPDDGVLASFGPTNAADIPAAPLDDIALLEKLQEETRRAHAAAATSSAGDVTRLHVVADLLPAQAEEPASPAAHPQRPPPPRRRITRPPPSTPHQKKEVKPIIRPLPIRMMLGGAGLILLLVGAILLSINHTPSSHPMSISTPQVAMEPSRSPNCIAETSIARLPANEQGRYSYGCRAQRGPRLFRCQTGTMCRVARDLCDIHQGVMITPEQSACLADPTGHALSPPAP